MLFSERIGFDVAPWAHAQYRAIAGTLGYYISFDSTVIVFHSLIDSSEEFEIVDSRRIPAEEEEVPIPVPETGGITDNPVGGPVDQGVSTDEEQLNEDLILDEQI
jgi:hypothetical protein